MKVLYWISRILGIALILYISMFAMDVINGDFKLKALLIHLMPSFLLIIILIVSWKNELVGGILYVIFGLVAGFMTGFRWNTFIGISLPVVITGILFIIQGICRIKCKVPVNDKKISEN
jgi:hypothetical protein